MRLCGWQVIPYQKILQLCFDGIHGDTDSCLVFHIFRKWVKQCAIVVLTRKVHIVRTFGRGRQKFEGESARRAHVSL